MKHGSINIITILILIVANGVGTGNATAAQGIIPACKYTPLASNPITTGVPNTEICVDIPNQLSSNHVVFNIDSLATKDGSEDGVSVALRHMWLLGSAMRARANAGLMDKADIQIIGVMHGDSLTWAMSDDWWRKKLDKNGRQLYPNGNPQKEWIEKLLALNNDGLNIQLEACAVAMSGKGLTRDDVYSSPNGRVYVNQGALGRIIYLQQQGYAYIQEGWVDNDSIRHRHDDD